MQYSFPQLFESITTKKMKEQKKSRRSFFLKSAGLAATAAITGWFGFSSQKKKTDTVKMLTQDGHLVDIDKKLLVSSGKKISDKELQKWINK